MPRGICCAINVLDHRGKNLSYDVDHTKIDDEASSET